MRSEEGDRDEIKREERSFMKERMVRTKQTQNQRNRLKGNEGGNSGGDLKVRA